MTSSLDPVAHHQPVVVQAPTATQKAPPPLPVHPVVRLKQEVEQLLQMRQYLLLKAEEKLDEVESRRQQIQRIELLRASQANNHNANDGDSAPLPLPPKKRQRTARQVIAAISKVDQEVDELHCEYLFKQEEKTALIETLTTEQKVSADEINLNKDMEGILEELGDKGCEKLELGLELNWGCWPLPNLT